MITQPHSSRNRGRLSKGSDSCWHSDAHPSILRSLQGNPFRHSCPLSSSLTCSRTGGWLYLRFAVQASIRRPRERCTCVYWELRDHAVACPPLKAR
ncbi:hypothetical protein PM082_015630 [Marasmius tenuissimus]|nr:hypothetical protein PM082_015630 [Marasmius tenuissimus]